MRMAIDTESDLWKQVLAEILVGFKVTHLSTMCKRTPFLQDLRNRILRFIPCFVNKARRFSHVFRRVRLIQVIVSCIKPNGKYRAWRP